MQLSVYCVYDNKSLAYGVPFFAPTDGSAIRSFGDLSNDNNTTVGRHPADFALFCIGSYDDQKAALSPILPLRHVVDAVALLIMQRPLPLTDTVDVSETTPQHHNGRNS